MTYDEWEKKRAFLAKSIHSLRGHARSGRNDLKKKLEYLERLTARQEELRLHKLNKFTLVVE